MTGVDLGKNRSVVSLSRTGISLVVFGSYGTLLTGRWIFCCLLAFRIELQLCLYQNVCEWVCAACECVLFVHVCVFFFVFFFFFFFFFFFVFTVFDLSVFLCCLSSLEISSFFSQHVLAELTAGFFSSPYLQPGRVLRNSSHTLGNYSCTPFLTFSHTLS